MVPFAEYAPDRAAFNNPGTDARNVFASGDHWKPMPTLTAITTALSGQVYAGLGVLTAGGTAELYAATQKRLHRLGSTSFSDISRGGADYTVATTPSWQMVQSKNRVFATNFADLLQTTQIGAAANFANVAGADTPRARRIAQTQRHLIVGDTSDATDGDMPNRVWWAALGDPMTWPLRGTAAAAAAQSDYEDLELGAGRVIGISGWEYGVVFQERAITRMTYVGAPLIYSFDGLDKNRGCTCPNAIVQFGRRIFFVCEEGFFITEGTGESIPIGQDRVSREFINTVDKSRFEMVTAAIDEVNGLVLVGYPSSGSGLSYNDRCLIYSYRYDKWSRADHLVEIFVQMLTPGYTLEQMDAFGTVDAQVVTWDSDIYKGGKRTIGAFDSAHKLSGLTGTPGTAYFDTGDFDDDENDMMFVSGVRPVVDGGSPMVRIGSKKLSTDSPTWSPQRSVTPATGFADFRQSNMYHRIEVQLSGDFGKAVGVKVESQDDGRR